MAITAISRDLAPNTCIVRIDSTDTFAEIIAPGYLTSYVPTVPAGNLLSQAVIIEALQHGDFQWSVDDIVLINYGTGAGFFIPNFSLTSSPDLVVTSFTPLATGYTNSAIVAVSSAQILGMYATPVLMVPAAGPHTWVVASTPIAVEYDFGTTQYAAGGAIGLQYGSTAHLAGTAASSTEAAATFNAFAASNGFTLNAAATGTMASMVNQGIYLSNATAAFTTGDGTMLFNINYSVFLTNA